jgi:hypothetical protein
MLFDITSDVARLASTTFCVINEAMWILLSLRYKTDSLTAVCCLQGEFPDDGGAAHHRNMSEFGLTV